jgi:hypothetical protein
MNHEPNSDTPSELSFTNSALIEAEMRLYETEVIQAIERLLGSLELSDENKATLRTRLLEISATSYWIGQNDGRGSILEKLTEELRENSPEH